MSLSVSRELDEQKFEDQLELIEYIASLRHLRLPFKFAYIGPAAYTHDELVSSPEYGITDTEASLIKSKFTSVLLRMLSNEANIIIIDIGSGNGRKAINLLQPLQAQGGKLSYLALDYSKTLMDIAEKNILKALAGVKITKVRVDFEAGPFGKILEELLVPYNSAFFLLLGQTLGNPRDRLTTLRNISDSMRSSDYLIVGVELFQTERLNDILKHYTNEVFHKAIFNPLSFSGIQRDDGQIEVIFNQELHDVEVYFCCEKNITIQLPSGETLDLKKGTRILIGLSHRFDQQELYVLFSNANLKIRQFILDEASSYALVVSQLL